MSEKKSVGGVKATLRGFLKRLTFWKVVRWLAIAVVGLWLVGVLMIVALKWIDPPTTAVQSQRWRQSLFSGKPYKKQYHFVPMSQISLNLQHAAVAGEDARFYQHHGFDWQAMELAAEDDLDGAKKIRGGSTITQQLVKNLFFGTSRSLLRKGAEATLVPVAEFVLGKERILELYLNVVEMGPGVYGVDAASHYWYRTSAKSVGRQQAALMISILPSPLKRRPEKMLKHAGIVLEHMSQMGW